MPANHSTTRGTPNQDAVNFLAAFVEAAEELQHEPFFGPDDKAILRVQGEAVEVSAGDRFHFRSALTTFRRIWMNDEASSFLRICKLIERYEGSNLMVDIARDQFQQACDTKFGNLTMSSKEIVNLWLYGVFSHTNLTGSNPKNSRIDFEKAANTYGAAQLELFFRITVKTIGGAAVPNLLKIARITLIRWEKEYAILPDFVIGTPFGKAFEEVDSKGVRIVRRPSTAHLGGEAPQQQFDRILARDEFICLKRAIDHVRPAGDVLLTAVRSSKTFSELLGTLGFQLLTLDTVDVESAYSRLGGINSPRAVSRAEDPATSLALPMVVESDGSFHTTPQAANYFDLKLAKLRDLIMAS